MESTMSETEHQLLLDSIKDHAIFMIDTDGIITSWNEGAKRLKGYEDEEVVGKHFRMLFLPEDQEGRPEDEARKALETGRFEEEWWRLRKDGSRFWAHVILHPVFNEANEHIGFAKITTDRTQQRRMDELNTFLMNEVAGYAIFLLDKSGKITKWSKAAEKIIGFKEAEVLGKTLSILYPDNDTVSYDEEISQHLTEALEGKHENEAWKAKKDGSYFWANYVITPLHNKDGYVVMIRDLTDKRAFEQESKANIALQTSNKELERFAFVVSHDLKEPVRKISTYCGLLQAETPNQGKKIETILNACKRLTNLIDDILEYSTLAENKPVVKQDLNFILSDVLESLAEMMREKQAVVNFKPLPTAAVIPSQIEQLFQNLISNALKFCCLDNKNPEINIDSVIIPKEEMDGALLNMVTHANEYLQINVRDNGIGFEQEYAETIFDLFNRLHRRSEFEGTGVGLSICKKVAEHHGGNISARSEKGRGTTFTVTLPLGDAG